MTEQPIDRESGVPGMAGDVVKAQDSTTERANFKAFYERGRYIGRNEGYGATINDNDRLFYSTREPVGVWWVKGVAYDIWDNWFRVINPDNVDDMALDRQVQAELLKLRSKIQLPRETVFERRYGTSILLLSYSGFGDDANWETPLWEGDVPPETLDDSKKLLQTTPFAWSQVEVMNVENNESSLRFGLPTQYNINTGNSSGDGTSPQGVSQPRVIHAHWTRVIHDAPRLDEDEYLGVAAIDSIFDDLVGGRNARWGAYESYYRYGTGFPVIKTKATAAQNQAWVDAGGLDDFMHVRGYFICNVDEDFSFVGAEGNIPNATPTFDMYFTFIAAATGVAKDSISGISAGRVTGNESNERKYFKAITLQQNQKEPMLRELIDRLIQTNQVEYDGEYIIEWIDPFEVNPQDKAAIEFMETRTLALQTWKTINEIRAEQGLDPVDDGDRLMLLPGQMVPEGSESAPNQQEPEMTETEPEETEQNESTLLDRIVNGLRGR